MAINLSRLTLTAPRGMAPDTLGHLWVAENNSTSLAELSTLSGTALSTQTTPAAPFGLAIDRANNVWYGVPASATQDLFELQQAAGHANVTFTTKPVFTSATRGVAIDASQNIWVSGFAATTNTAGVFPNTGTESAPQYGAAAGGSALNTTLTGIDGAGIALDVNGDAWTATTTGLFQVVPTPPSSTITNLTATGPIADGSILPNYDAVDGSGSIWLANNSGTAPAQSINQYVPGTTTLNTYSPCYAPFGATTCTAALSQPQRTQVDSTGSVWITSLSNGRIYQLLGTGAPTWPQLSLGAPGVMPQ